MIRQRLKSAHFSLRLGVFLTPLAAFALAAYIRFATRLLPGHNSDVDARQYFGLLLLITTLWAIFAEHFELTSIENYLLTGRKISRALKACAVTYVAVLALTFFYRSTSFSRLFIWMSAINLFLFTLVLQSVFAWLWERKGSRGHGGFQVLIVGVDEFAFRVADTLTADRIAPCRIKGHIRIPAQICSRNDAKVYEMSQIEELAINNGIDDVIIAIPPALLGELKELRQKLSALCAPMRLALDIGEDFDAHQHLFSVGDLLMLDLQGTPAESVLYIILKRAFDLVFSATVLTLLSPLFLAIALAVRLSSPGPIFFVQDRVGLNGKLFRMLKFRTMIHAPTETYTRWTVKDDPRCTRVGRFLRQTALDELPQFFNVLKGDMSVVGPRPEGPILVQKFMQSVGDYNRRHHLKVGITGWAQVNGWRGNTSIEKRIEYDLYYVRHWTLGFDLLIVALTFLRGFTDKNAY
jgi:Undecaprenyl-phosphate glucose phosphotransferase